MANKTQQSKLMPPSPDLKSYQNHLLEKKNYMSNPSLNSSINKEISDLDSSIGGFGIINKSISDRGVNYNSEINISNSINSVSFDNNIEKRSNSLQIDSNLNKSTTTISSESKS